MKKRLVLLGVALLGLLAVAFAPATHAATAQTASDPTSLEVVQAAYTLLLDDYVQPLDPATLLGAGWGALTDTLQQAGAPAPPALGSLPSGPDAAFAAFTQVYDSYITNLPGRLTPQLVAFAVADGMASSLNDSHTAFLTPQAYQGFLKELSGGGSSIGLGIEIAQRPPFVITSLAPGGPAESAGLQQGDVIVAVDGKDVTNATSSALSTDLRGNAGTMVTLSVQRGGGQLDITVTRGSYYFPPLSSRMLPGNVGYIKLTNFVVPGATLPNGTEIISDFDRRLNALEAQGATGLVLDLRNDPGGSSFTAAEILGRFLPPDQLSDIVFDGRGDRAINIVAGPESPTQLPLAVLVNGQSASASEIVASTLKEANRAVLVGERTAGALGSAQIFPLPEGAALYVDLAEVETAQQNVIIEGHGYPVDVQVADTRTAADYAAGRDPQLQAAVAALTNAPVPPAPVPVSAQLSKDQLTSMLSGYLPSAAQIPPTVRLPSANVVVQFALTQPNEWVTSGGDTAAPVALLQMQRQRGYLGSYAQGYGSSPAGLPFISVQADLYASVAGAAAAAQSNDFPESQQVMASPVQLGSNTVAYRGIWEAAGSISMAWQEGNIVFTVAYADVPGSERPDVLAQVAQIVDAAYQANPLMTPPSKLVAGSPALLPLLNRRDLPHAS